MQFDVFENRNPATRQRFPYLLDVQADLLDALESRVVIPLASTSSPQAVLKQLMPVLQVKNQNYVAYTPQLAGIARRNLGLPVANLAGARAEITAALDLLLTGA